MGSIRESMIRALLLFLEKAEQEETDALPPEHLLAAVKAHGFDHTEN